MPTPPSSTGRFAVIGGGLAGLAAAWHLCELAVRDGRQVCITLFEATGRLGGLLASERIGDCLVELGADSFITNKPAAVRLCERLGIADQLVPTDSRFRGAYILHNGQPVATPKGFNLLVPGDLPAVLASPLLSEQGKQRCLQEQHIPPRLDDADESLAEFTRRRLGQEVLDRIVQPLVGGIYTSDPEKLSLRATLPRFQEMERQHGSLIAAARNEDSLADREATGARYSLFTAPRDGIDSLVAALRDRVTEAGVMVRTGVRVESVRPVGTSSEFEVTLTASHAAEATTSPSVCENFDAVIVALPTHRTATVVENWQPELACELAAIEYASSAIVVTGHRTTDIVHPLDAFGLVIPHIEQRRVLAVSFLHRKFPGRAPDGTAILRTFVGGALQPENLNLDDDALIDLVRSELRDLLGVHGRPLFTRVARYPRAMPQYHVGHLARVARIESLIGSLPGFAIAGNALYGVGIPDTIQSGETAAETVWRASP